MYNMLKRFAENRGFIVKEKPLRAYDGLLCGNRIAILDRAQNKYYILAHELAHAYLHTGDTINSPFHEQYELEADKVAKLIMDIINFTKKESEITARQQKGKAMKILSVATQKGGEGKTTTSSVILYSLNQKGYKTLAIDLDPQRNLTKLTKANEDSKTVFDVLTGEISILEAIQHTDFGDIVPASQKLGVIDAALGDDLAKPYKLKEALKHLKGYDYVVLDNPPALGTLTVNALTCSDYVVIPAQADIDGLQGIADLYGTIESAQTYTNPNLKVAGILVTRFQARTNLSQNIKSQLQHIAERLDTVLFNTTIRESIIVKESRYRRVPLMGSEYRREGVFADYSDFIKQLIEIIERGAENG